MGKAVSPLKPAHLPQMPEIAGVRLATAAAGIRYAGRTEGLLVDLDKPTGVAGVFTRSKCPSAPVEWCRARIGGGRGRALVVNSGNANAFTGKRGVESVRLAAKLAAPPRPAMPAQGRTTITAWSGRMGLEEKGDVDTANFVIGGRERFHADREYEQELHTTPAHLADYFDLQGPNCSCLTACAAGTQAIGEALELIRRDEADVMLAGGSEAPLAPLTFGAFAIIRAMSTSHADSAKSS